MAVYQPKTVQKEPTLEFTEDGTDPVRAELAREQERLRKLWDAFKSQEDELVRLRAAPPAAAAPTTTAGGSEALRREVDLLTGDLRRAADAQRRLEEENQALRDNAKVHAEVARQLASAQSDLDEERERLAKLFAVYEEVDAERKRLESRIKEWEAWFHGASPHIMELARSIQGAPRES